MRSISLSLQLDLKKNNIKMFINMHSTGFEPVMFHRKTDYESGAFNHSATNAKMEVLGSQVPSFHFINYTDKPYLRNFFRIFSYKANDIRPSRYALCNARSNA